jgi:transposase-like protein
MDVLEMVLANSFNDIRIAWQNSKLDEYYKVVYFDAIYMTLRRDDSYSKEAVHIERYPFFKQTLLF